MIHTSLDIHTARTAQGTTAIFAVIGTRQVLIGESKALGAKRAKLELFNLDPNVGSGRALKATLVRLERDQDKLDRAEHDRQVAEWDAEDALLDTEWQAEQDQAALLRAADDLGIDLSECGA
jgi:hypothetical protein